MILTIKSISVSNTSSIIFINAFIPSIINLHKSNKEYTILDVWMLHLY